MENQFERTEILIGADAMKRLRNSRVAVFGVGGVGGYVAEALARSGVGAFELIDRDQVSITNLNRQIIATWKTVGRDKVEVMAERIRDINPEAEVVMRKCFYLPETAQDFEKIFVSAGRVGNQVELSPADLSGLVSAEYADVVE